MRTRALLGPVLALPVLLAEPAQAIADDGSITPYDLPRNSAYEREVRFSRLQDDITYVESRVGPLPLDGLTVEAPARPSDTEAGDRTLRLGARLGLVLLAAAMLVLGFRNRHILADRFGGDTRMPTRAAARTDDRVTGAMTAAPGLIGRLRAMTDRRAALVRLIEAVLGAAAQANGLRLGRSETARELLSRVPRDWPHFSALRGLVMAEELVRFGGRPLPDATFEACLDRAAPILSEPPA